jgi:excinuclease ABC subunit B
MSKFQLQSQYEPAGDQASAIKTILEWFAQWSQTSTLLGATGTGKTFTMANIIQSLGKATLVISHNKTLAAQLATEFKHFFPNNAVHYFVSYFDYYQPESYLAHKDIYIEKEATVNKEIEMYRLSTMASLLTRDDVIVVSSVSALYGLWAKESFGESTLNLQVGQKYDHKETKAKLIAMQYKPSAQKFESGMFDFRGEILDIYSSTEKFVYRCIFDEDVLAFIEKRDGLTWEAQGTIDHVLIWPSSQYIQDQTDIDNILIRIQWEMEDRVKLLESQGRIIEAHRLQKRVMYDVRMIKETGFTNGIENYSMYFEDRDRGETPNTIFDYFPDDMLVIMDESHMSVPQMRSMPSADRSRKYSLIEHGFRLPSAGEHRPLWFEELEYMLGWKNPDFDHAGKKLTTAEKAKAKLKAKKEEKFLSKFSNDINISPALLSKIKKSSKTIFVSATPADYEMENGQVLAEQIIRPTGLLDPITYIYPKSWDYKFLLSNMDKTIEKKPQIVKFLDGYHHATVEDVFEDMGIDEMVE